MLFRCFCGCFGFRLYFLNGCLEFFIFNFLGGTVDFILMGVVKDEGLEVLYEVVGGVWGGIIINVRIWKFMEEFLIKDVIDEFKK